MGFSAEKIGHTILAASITTGGSGIFMFLCQMTFFTKMAVLMCSTISFSLIYSQFFFMPLCLLFGPNEQNACSLNKLCPPATANITADLEKNNQEKNDNTAIVAA